MPLLLKRSSPNGWETDDLLAENSEPSSQESQPPMVSGNAITVKTKERRKTFQKTIRSFFQTSESGRAEASGIDLCHSQVHVLDKEESVENLPDSGVEKNSVALLEWRRIQQRMQTSLPLCKGHKEPCVARFVKKSGPNMGRGFYVCSRAKVFKFKDEKYIACIFLTQMFCFLLINTGASF